MFWLSPNVPTRDPIICPSQAVYFERTRVISPHACYGDVVSNDVTDETLRAFALESSSVLPFLWRFWTSKSVGSGFEYVMKDYDMVFGYLPLYPPTPKAFVQIMGRGLIHRVDTK